MSRRDGATTESKSDSPWLDPAAFRRYETVAVSIDQYKREAARAALQHLPERGVVGLGSGSTARLFIEEVGQLVRAGRELRGVATSEDSRRQALELGIEVLDDAGPWEVDVCVDGADEVSAQLDLIKGGGGCHSREKVVNQASRFNVIIVDESKLSEQLGERWAVPVEVLPFGLGSTRRWLERFGSVTRRRAREGEAPFVTDSGNALFDLSVGAIDDPRALDRQLLSVPGVVETGLFVERADLVLIAGQRGIRERRRSGERG